MEPDKVEYPPIIGRALTNTRLAPLLASIEAETPISWEQSDNTEWGSTTANGRTTIYYTNTAKPTEALAHELLHAELKIQGYRQYCTSIAKAPCQSPRLVSVLLEILDNELQHHRMAERFSSYGLNLINFYNDGDKNSYKKVRKGLHKPRASQLPRELSG